MVCCRFLSVGLISLTAIYVGLIVALEYLALPAVGADCLDDQCQTEGVDNTIVNWVSDFFIAIFMFLFAIHLAFFQTNVDDGYVRKSGILAQIFMGGAFVLAGIGHWLYPNSGLDDNRGMLGYWIVWIGFSVFFTISSLATAHFGLEAEADRVKVEDDDDNKPWYRWCLFGDDDDDDEHRVPHKCTKCVPLCQLLLLLSLTGFLVGGAWCSVTSDLLVNGVVDEFEATDEIATCLQIMSISGTVLHASYALMWIPIGLLLRAACRKSPLVLLGLRTPIAAGTCILLQWSVGSMLIVYLEFTNFIRNGETSTTLELSNTIYGTVLYHWGMLLTFYCLHNVSCGLTIRPHNSSMKEKKEQTAASGQQDETEGSWWDFDWLTTTLCMGFAGHKVAEQVKDDPEVTDDESARKTTAAADTDEESATKTNAPDSSNDVDTSSVAETSSETGSRKKVKFEDEDD
jgi:hypothetical protein